MIAASCFDICSSIAAIALFSVTVRFLL